MLPTKYTCDPQMPCHRHRSGWVARASYARLANAIVVLLCALIASASHAVTGRRLAEDLHLPPGSAAGPHPGGQVGSLILAACRSVSGLPTP